MIEYLLVTALVALVLFIPTPLTNNMAPPTTWRARCVRFSAPTRAAVLEGKVEMMAGMTPFMRFGNGPLPGASLALLLACWSLAR